MKSIHNNIKHWSAVFALVIFTCLSACDDEDPPQRANTVDFEVSDQIGFDADENTITMRINFSSETTKDAEVIIDVTATGITYGTEFTTDPVMTGNSIALAIPAGSTQVSFDVIRNEDVALDGDESISFTISQVGQHLVVGTKNQITLAFSEILATHVIMDPNVGGQLQPNKVFIDLSANRQTAVNRGDWDLGFYTETDQFRVMLNSSSSMMARVLDKNDLNAVTATDTIGWGAQLSTDGVFAGIIADQMPDWIPSSINWIDAPSGDISATAITEVAQNDGDNKVYIVNRGKNPDGSERGWKKIRVIRDGDNYTLQHADINATTFETVAITRDDAYHFNYVNFDDGAVEVEPKKDKWDIAFTVFTNTTPSGAEVVVPYVFSDVVLQNRYKTKTKELLVAEAGAYKDFDVNDLNAFAVEDFSTNQINIGSRWRSGGGPGSSPAIKEDRFYLVEDAEGNTYKLKFTALTQNGERGRPQIEFDLLETGE